MNNICKEKMLCIRVSFGGRPTAQELFDMKESGVSWWEPGIYSTVLAGHLFPLLGFHILLYPIHPLSLPPYPSQGFTSL